MPAERHLDKLGSVITAKRVLQVMLGEIEREGRPLLFRALIEPADHEIRQACSELLDGALSQWPESLP